MRAVRALDALGVLIVCVLFAMASRDMPLAMVPAALALLSLAPREGLRMDAFAQAAASLVCGVLPALVAANTLDREPPPGALDPVSGSVALATLGAAAIRPLFVARRASGLVNSGLLLASLSTVGQARLGPLYALAAGLACVLSLAARATERKPAHPLARTSAREVLALSAILLVAAGGTLLGAWSLPIAHRWSIQRVMRAYSRSRNVSGLGDRMGLEAMDGILQSDAIVLRVRGARTDYLRGVVFDRYRFGAWSYSRAVARRSASVEHRVSPAILLGETEIRRLSGPPAWVLLPADASHVAAPSPTLDVLSSGVARSPIESDLVWFRSGSTPWITGDAPVATDSEVPRALRRTLDALVREWGCHEGDPEARVRCLEHNLRQRYRYSLTVPESAAAEPLAAFLQVHKRGHCEYFASALTMLSRASGVAARVVAGYRVHERSEWGDYFVVRERDAHSWTEAFVPGRGWTRFDATPPSALEVSDRSGVARWRTYLESLRWRLADVTDWIRARSVLRWAIVALVIVLVASVLRRRLRGRGSNEDSAADAPTDAMRALLDALARRGLRRARGETLERFAERVVDSEFTGEIAVTVRGELLAYAAARYGADGGASLDERLRAAARLVNASPAT